MIIWLSSYPKSGNTWVRSFLSSLIYTENGEANFKSLENIIQYPQRRFFNQLDDPRYSEGYRIFILSKIVDFVLINPVTGSGFLGCWVLFDTGSCSTHNQYTDVLFRTGFIGFLIYIYILLRILKYLKKMHNDLFFGLIGVLIYGLFHETFKLSQGAFILSFLFAMTFSINKSSYKNNQII